MGRASEAIEDVIIAGGGVAGACAAAALGALGYRVNVVEPGLLHERRLAGELLHPPALADLEALGLADVLSEAGAQHVEGFAVCIDDDAHLAQYVLPYGTSVGGASAVGAALEHGRLATALLARARTLPGVEVIDGARVSGVEHEPAAVCVTITSGANQQTRRARLLIAADGRGSTVRRLAGIDAVRVTHSNMEGYLVETDALPWPKHGHVFTDGRTPVLAYEIAPGRVRVMIDRVQEPHDRQLRTLPSALREAVLHATQTQKPRMAANVTVRSQALFRGRVALLGDAAGCSHPVSASGIASTTADAVALASALRGAGGDVPAALARYARMRADSHRTRLALATALFRAFSEPTPEMVLLRQGLMRYWERSAEGRAASMALLSTAEPRLGVMAREYARVVAYALPSLAGTERRRRALTGLLGSAVRSVFSVPYAGSRPA